MRADAILQALHRSDNPEYGGDPRFYFQSYKCCKNSKYDLTERRYYEHSRLYPYFVYM
jgi:hypothetical protein